jgi:Bucentaur or craniofacial development
MTSGAAGKIMSEKPITNATDLNEAVNADPAREKESPSNTTTIADMPSSSAEGGPDNMIIIHRTYNFAGKVHTEEKMVARDSAEARLWLQSQPSEAHSQPGGSKFSKPLRPPKKARRSIFEPIADPLPQRTDLRFGVNANSNRQTGLPVYAKKLNTVEKSKMDWAGFVDKEGIKDELEMAGKAKGSYMNQTEFLVRVEEKREEEARKARLKTIS